MNRRRFLHHMSASGALISAGAFPLGALAREEIQRLVILHTNDVHSRIDPFPLDGSRMAGLGGAARRSALISAVRAKEPHVLLLDSGDIFQGTPYFNMFGGELEFKLMSEMQYDAATLGNHDFDAGVSGLVRQMPKATFPIVVCNYDFADTEMHGHTVPSLVLSRGDLRIGILGVGIELQGLVPGDLYQNTRYLDPIANANKAAAFLRREHKCHLVICLSHLGYRYQNARVSDITLARSSSDIDIILGGHTHTFLNEPELVLNAAGRPVVINQVGWAGVRLGRIDVTFERNRLNRCVTCENLWVR